MQKLDGFRLPVDKVLTYLVKPIVEQENIMGGAVGTRIVAPDVGVNNGDPIVTYTRPDALIQARPSDATFKAETATPFGDWSVNSQTWALMKHWIYTKMSPSLFNELIGVTAKDPQLILETQAKNIMNYLVTMLGYSINKDVLRHAFWSHTAHDFDTDYSGTHTFDPDTETSLKLNLGFAGLIKDGIGASTVTNFSTTSPLLDNSVLTAANAKVLIDKIIDQAPIVLRNYNRGMPSSFRPKILLSDNWYEAFMTYISTTYAANNEGYFLFGYTAEGNIDSNNLVGLRYKGYEVYPMSGVFDDYWGKTGATGNLYKHMGLMVAPENLRVGFNLDSAMTGNEVGAYGLEIVRNNNAKAGGFFDTTVFMQMDFAIRDLTLCSTVGFEKAP